MSIRILHGLSVGMALGSHRLAAWSDLVSIGQGGRYLAATMGISGFLSGELAGSTNSLAKRRLLLATLFDATIESWLHFPAIPGFWWANQLENGSERLVRIGGSCQTFTRLCDRLQFEQRPLERCRHG
jgi:hypothetical protein